MKRMIENITGNYTASASVVDGTLILSLPDAITPIVWRLDLVHAKASALEVREGDGGLFILALKTPRGDVNEIAKFASRGRAVAALMSVTRAMEQAHGQVKPIANDGEPYNPTHLPVPVRTRRAKTQVAQPGNGKGLIGGVIALLLIIGLGAILLNMNPKQVTSLSSSSPAAGNAATAKAQESGVAVSADDFLKNR
jgi:hypothetical protein